MTQNEETNPEIILHLANKGQERSANYDDLREIFAVYSQGNCYYGRTRTKLPL